jgi:hypothetical protein
MDTIKVDSPEELPKDEIPKHQIEIVNKGYTRNIEAYRYDFKCNECGCEAKIPINSIYMVLGHEYKYTEVIPYIDCPNTKCNNCKCTYWDRFPNVIAKEIIKGNLEYAYTHQNIIQKIDIYNLEQIRVISYNSRRPKIYFGCDKCGTEEVYNLPSHIKKRLLETKDIKPGFDICGANCLCAITGGLINDIRLFTGI